MMEGVNLTTIYCKHFVNVPMYPQYNMIIKIKKNLKKRKRKSNSALLWPPQPPLHFLYNWCFSNPPHFALQSRSPFPSHNRLSTPRAPISDI
jgi:hypothetical protein